MPVQTRRSSRKSVKGNIRTEDEVSSEISGKDISESYDLESLVSHAYNHIASKILSKKDCNEIRDLPNSRESAVEDFDDRLVLPAEILSEEKDATVLASELQPRLEPTEMYLSLTRPSTVSSNIPSASLANIDKLMKKSVITSDFEKKHTAPPMRESYNQRQWKRKQATEQSAGPKWFDLPATTVTPELKQELKVLKMRHILDPKRHYKKNDSKELPKYFQMGTVVEGAADFYSSRIPKRSRKNNIVQELLADAQFRRYNKKKFLEIQAAKESGRKGFYKKKTNRRKPAWARK
ncbi:deoxynucleotidyltransferase terminal-interacting protein 2 [Nematostella vectensis]|nr:deoxynucleotidyltransferase terminal-interacting protein 2 [Nematostella vectensis]